MKTKVTKIVEREIDIPGLCQAMSEASPVPMVAVAGVGNIIRYVNPAFCILANQLKDDLIGRTFDDAIPAGHECLALLDRVYRTAQAEMHIGDEKSPHPVYWSYAMWPAVAADGEIVGIVVQVTESSAAHEHTTAMNQALLIGSVRQHELTERAEALNVQLHAEIVERTHAEEELRRSNEDLERFTYIASHDLQEPLRTVTAYTQLLARRLGAHLDADAEMFVKYILDGSSRMSALIKDLLTYARVGVEEGQGTAPVDCGKAVEEALLNLQHSIQETAAAVTVDDPLPLVAGNFPQLVQVFQNLIANALKYRKPDCRPNIRISANRRNGEWIFLVRDNGIGFDPQYAEQIFGAFKRLHSAQYPGTGIGLAICKRIVALHRGRIWATGEEGRGATFFFTLPEVPGASG
jgi:signal transduction histidine kinase